MYKFAAASDHEQIVFGAARPGYTNNQISEWIEFMQQQSILRVCCLLSKTQLSRYADLLGVYQQAFGLDQICWAPIEDFNVADPAILIHQILPFLAIAPRIHNPPYPSRSSAFTPHQSLGIPSPPQTFRCPAAQLKTRTTTTPPLVSRAL